jgi:hypothetical protein
MDPAVPVKGINSMVHSTEDRLIGALTTPPFLTRKDENNRNVQSHEEAIERLFWSDKKFMDMCSDGLHRKLTRTKDGGNTKEQLAQLVKLLRQCVTGYGDRLKALKDIILSAGNHIFGLRCARIGVLCTLPLFQL